MTNAQNIEKVAQKFTHPTASLGKTTWPTSKKELQNIGFHFDVSDVTKTIADTRPGAAKGATRKAYVFKWQAASEAERKSIKDWARANGSHAEAATLVVPEDASHEEFTKIVNDAAEKL